MQFTLDHFKDIEERFLLWTPNFTQKNCTPLSYFSLLEIHYNTKAMRGCGFFFFGVILGGVCIYVCMYVFFVSKCDKFYPSLLTQL